MEFSAGAAAVAGLIGAVVMAIPLYIGLAMMPQQMTMNLLYMLGTMATRNAGAAYVMGAMMHGVMGIVFALVHVGIYQALGLESGLIGWGAVIGLVHGLIIGGMGLPMTATMHPLMRSGEMQAPGILLKNYPSMTIMGFFMLHVLYGVVVAAVYEASI